MEYKSEYKLTSLGADSMSHTLVLADKLKDLLDDIRPDRCSKHLRQLHGSDTSCISSRAVH